MIKAQDWTPADGLKLENNAFLAATNTVNSIALMAGPGAGKTEVLAQRADFLLRTGNCPYPKRILAISFKKDASKNIKERVKKRCGVDLARRFDSYTFHAFAKIIIDRFRTALEGPDALNSDYTIGNTRIPHKQIKFDDFFYLAQKILINSEVALNAIRKTYSDVFLDEFQDCTDQQYELIKLIFKNTNIRVVSVGDTKQKIMTFANALEGIFIKFSGDFSAISMNLYLNFRAQPLLRRMQNEVIKVFDPESPVPEELLQGSGGELYYNHYSNHEEEAKDVVQKIKTWIDIENIPINEIAILIPKQLDSYAHSLMDLLEKNGVPYINEHASQDMMCEPLVQLVTDYLLVLLGDREPLAWSRLMQTIESILEQEKDFVQFKSFLTSQQKQIGKPTFSQENFNDIWEMVKSFIKHLGKDFLIGMSYEYNSPRLKEVLNFIKGEIKDIIDKGQSLVSELKVLHDNSNAVRILTVHKSKGLEFDTVIMLGIEKQTFWGKKDEERCVFFVGISRAKRRLFLTSSAYRARPKGHRGIWNVNREIHQEYMTYISPHLLQ